MHVIKEQPPRVTDPHVHRRMDGQAGTDAARPARGALLGLALLLTGALALNLWLVSQTAVILVTGMAALLLWSCAAAGIQYLYALIVRESAPVREQTPVHGKTPVHGRVAVRERIFGWLVRLPGNCRRHFVVHFPTLWQWVLLFGAVVSGTAFLFPYFRFPPELGQSSSSTLRFAAVAFLSIAGVLYLYGNYMKALQKRLESPLIIPMRHLCWVVFLACSATGGMLLVYLSTGRDVCWLGWAVLSVTAVLALEPVLRATGRFYQPRMLRRTPPPVGASVVLDFLLGSGHDARGVVKSLEELAGMKVGEIWVFQFFKESIEIVVAVGLLVGWLSTCVTVVPLGSRGVLSSFGRYREPALGPGLHVSLPWPVGQVHVIAAEQVREISLGFEKDLSKPLLWTEKHVEGEKNLLIGGGESLLTINVPIQFRVSDPIAYLRNTTDAEVALKALAERKLIQIATAHEGFQMMTEDREAIAATLRQGIQSEVSRLSLGLEITFVGLKDIHPPVEVASAYENVVSAQERKEAMIDEARAYEARTLPLAYAEANTLKIGAGAAYSQRVNTATGQAGRFHFAVASEKANPDLFRTRLKYDALDETLPGPAKTIVSTPRGSEPEVFLDLRTSDAAMRQSKEMPRP